jgi:hypothetical protein
MSAFAACLCAAYRLLLGLYPRVFRDAFGLEMRAVFAELLDDTARRGPIALLAVTARELGGLARGLAREHRAALAQRGSLALTPIQHVLNGATLLLFGLLGGLYSLLERYGATLRYPLITAGTLVCGLAIGALVCWAIPRRRSLIALALFVAAICCTQAIDWDSRKPFLRALGRVQAGMHVAEVDGIMASYMRWPAAPGRLSPAGQATYRHTDQGWGDADLGVVTFDGDRVVKIEFLPD